MKTTTPLSRGLAHVLASVLAFAGFNALADSHEPPPPAVLETFLCSYVDGKDRDDLDSATEYYLKQAAKAEVGTPPAYLWSKIKGSADAQLIWHNAHESLSAFGAQMDAAAASSEMAAVTERYDSVVKCTPLLGSLTSVHQRGETNGGEGSFVAAYACRTNSAPDPVAFGDLNDHINGVLSDMGDAAPLASYAITPMTSDPMGPNAVYFNAFENVSHWTLFQNQLNATESGQMLVRHFTSMLSCGTNLWASERVVGDG